MREAGRVGDVLCAILGHEYNVKEYGPKHTFTLDITCNVCGLSYTYTPHYEAWNSGVIPRGGRWLRPVVHWYELEETDVPDDVRTLARAYIKSKEADQ